MPRGQRETLEEFVVEWSLNDSWLARETFVEDKGAWMPSGNPVLVCNGDESKRPTARLSRGAGFDSQVERLGALLAEALRMDGALNREARWSEMLVDVWGLTAPRSRRGRKREVDPSEIEELRRDGDDLYRIAAEQGFSSRQALSNCLYRDKQRRASLTTRPKRPL